MLFSLAFFFCKLHFFIWMKQLLTHLVACNKNWLAGLLPKPDHYRLRECDWPKDIQLDSIAKVGLELPHSHWCHISKSLQWTCTATQVLNAKSTMYNENSHCLLYTSPTSFFFFALFPFENNLTKLGGKRITVVPWLQKKKEIFEVRTRLECPSEWNNPPYMQNKCSFFAESPLE